MTIYKFEFEWAELSVYKGTINAKTEEEAREKFANKRPDDADHFECDNFAGGSSFDIYSVEKLIENRSNQ